MTLTESHGVHNHSHSHSQQPQPCPVRAAAPPRSARSSARSAIFSAKSTLTQHLATCPHTANPTLRSDPSIVHASIQSSRCLCPRSFSSYNILITPSVLQQRPANRPRQQPRVICIRATCSPPFILGGQSWNRFAYQESPRFSSTRQTADAVSVINLSVLISYVLAQSNYSVNSHLLYA